MSRIAQTFTLLVAATLMGFTMGSFVHGTAVHGEDTTLEGEVAALKQELTAIRELLPDQAHAMVDVSFHFANLYFAGKERNWDLAQFYLNEVRSHLRWAVRIKPKRPLSSGEELDLAGILGGMESSVLADLEASIKDKDDTRFSSSYTATRENCFACHQAAEKPFLRSRTPVAPPEPMLDFSPAAPVQP